MGSEPTKMGGIAARLKRAGLRVSRKGKLPLPCVRDERGKFHSARIDYHLGLEFPQR